MTEITSPIEAGAAAGLAELFRALGSLAEPPAPGTQSLADVLELGPVPTEAEHTELFLLQLPPYASVYLGPEGMLGGEARDRIAGFWRVLGDEPPGEPDHLTVMLAFYAGLAEEEDRHASKKEGAPRQARKAFLWEHLLCWLPPYLEAIRHHGPLFYRRWARLLSNALLEEVITLGEQERLPLHLRHAPDLADPRQEGAERFVASLLSPVRSGMILTRADLARAARELDLGIRAGERRFVLPGLLEQDPAAVLRWLGEEASSWSRRHSRGNSLAPPIAAFWQTRAEATAGLLADLP